jgi:hypothetical protein
MTQEQQSYDLQTPWQNQPTDSFQISLADIHQKAARLQRQIYWRNCREYIAAAILITFFGYIFWAHDTPLPRLGLALIIAAIIYAVYKLHRKGSASVIPSEMGSSACLDFHLKELQRQLDTLRNVWSSYLRPFVPGMALYLIGMTIPAAISPGTNKLWVLMSFSGSALFIALIFYGICRLNQRAADNLQHQIDALNAIERKWR